MNTLPQAHAKAADTARHQNLIRLCELVRAQAVKYGVEVNLKSITSCTPLSHACAMRREMPKARA
jgi:hypothetical protein